MFQKVDEARFLDGEHEVLRFWEEQRIFRRLQEQNRGKPKWSFLDGPITANNPMGVHHAWGRTYKDVFQRYRAMTGHELRYQNGFDCQGLWVEVEVEKQLKLGTKNAIERYGIDHFTRECKKRVLKFAARQTEQSIRLGYWMEWDNPEELRKLASAIGGVESQEGLKVEGLRLNEDAASSTINPKPSTTATVTYTTARGQEITGGAEQITAKLGNPEWGGSYFTFSTENNETIWTFLKKCFNRAKIYRGHDVMPWSGRGGSAYSQMEVADGRKLTTHRSCFVRFPLIVDKEHGTTEARRHGDEQLKEYLLIWTTTPWTLTANVAAAVNPDLDYVQIKAKIKGDSEPAIYYFAKDNLNFKRLEKEFKEGFGRPEWTWPEGVGKLKSIAQIFKEQGGFEELGTVKGAEMVGWRYAGPFDDLEAQQTTGGVEAHRVIDGGRDFKGNANVVAGEGTGIVHIAPGCGDIDHKIGVELGLPVIAPLGEDGRYGEGFGAFTGLEANQPATADLVFEELKKKDLLVNVETYPHIYPFCWRTGDELVFRLVDEWFINMDWREEIKDVTKAINWLPEAVQGQARELEWLTTMRDWMISKKRFWGLALPIWIDPENPSDFEVMGSLAELKERALDGGEGWEEFEAGGYTPHRPWIDKVKIRSQKTGKLLSRIEDVGNPWLDAGIVPFSTLGYQRSEGRGQGAAEEQSLSTLNSQPSALVWQDWYPADLVLECFPGQFRNWFYSLLSLSTMMRYDETDDPEEKKPFKNLFGHRLVMNEEGKPMHKSDGTAIWFEEAAEQLGVDTIRWMYLAQNPAVDLKFGTRHAGEPVTLQTPEGPISETKEGLTTCKVTSKPADDIRRQALIPLWNSYAFFVNYAVLDGFDPQLPQVPLADRPEIDRWVLSRLQELTKTAHESFTSYRVSDFMAAATEFIDDLSNWYIRRNRRRFWKAREEQSAVSNQQSTSPSPKIASPGATAEDIFRVYLSSQKLGLNRDRTTLVREVFSTSESFTLDQLMVRLSRYKDGKRLHRADVQRGLKQLEAAGLLNFEAAGAGVYHPAQPSAFKSPPSTPTSDAATSWDADKLAAYQTLYEVLVTLCKLLAPSIPFLTERMYRNLVECGESSAECESSSLNAQHSTLNAPISVHLCEYPVVDESKFDPDLNWKTHQVQALVRMAHRLREAAELRVRQPLAELRFACRDDRQAAALEQYRDVIADELNVKQITRAEHLDELVSYSFKPNLKTLGPKYGKVLNAIRTELATVDPAVMAPLRNGSSVTLTIGGEPVTLAPEDVMVSVQQASDWASADDDGIQIALSTKLTPELVAEGMARDMIRQIQQLRKDANLEENQRIHVQWSPAGSSAVVDVASVISNWEKTITAETRADAIEHVETAPLNGKNVTLGEVQIALAILGKE
ncbi:class I tRNA ligase family protein [Planctomicrobium sp. SH661]|uniref:class I tRNA ligase family protein n=1 Tax=Planctomicrobium sp. SH661 TaxID=3448124 RepID=UPI003F5C241F